MNRLSFQTGTRIQELRHVKLVVDSVGELVGVCVGGRVGVSIGLIGRWVLRRSIGRVGRVQSVGSGWSAGPVGPPVCGWLGRSVGKLVGELIGTGRWVGRNRRVGGWVSGWVGGWVRIGRSVGRSVGCSPACPLTPFPCVRLKYLTM